ncbi:flagellar protein FlaG [Pseudoalteromonas xiamenensis]|uniref:flagellar protein FlaG n=1 Tax=Pseudoalteromonas xiamenensis TaxID=882626 RepID=UPI0027E5222D|nr:flagellar protein FlaG [Pseudoalteromonas xiamenensis]WMN59374.1 flagellar protein FlaG [Pseudoalteromonas xiamenensis]
MKEVAVTPSHSPVELQLGQRDDKQSVTLRPIDAVEKSNGFGVEDEAKAKTKSALSDGTLIAEVKENLEKLNKYIPVTSTNLSFEFDESGDPPFIRVVDKENEEVIREIPSKEFREVAKALDELADKLSGKGLLFNQSA